ncbi:MAG TPA: GFA family protein [Parvularculaceae bacterium]|nr:GFA family protein [Parvularculaceae bacterium]HNS88385.1 GFA family protein [Parvularculaceae bacterium]
MTKSWKKGGCHCGAVRWEAETDDDIVADACNCSICSMTGFVHVIVPQSRFRLLKGEDAIATYAFNTGVAKHHFCKQCGVKSFYVPRSNPDGYSLNLNCMDKAQFTSIEIRPFDGRNWEANAAALAHLSKD